VEWFTPAALDGAGGRLRGAGSRVGSARQSASHFQRFQQKDVSTGLSGYIKLGLIGHFDMVQEASPLPPLAVDDVRAIEFKAFQRAIGKEADPTMLILRAHLFSESLLERLIPLKMRRGDKVIDNGSFTFAQKLVLVEAIDCLDDSIASSLRNLNKLRNQCAHELGRTITGADVTRIGSPLGKHFTKMQRDNNYEPVATLRALVAYVCGYVTGGCHAIEESFAKELQSKQTADSSPQPNLTSTQAQSLPSPVKTDA